MIKIERIKYQVDVGGPKDTLYAKPTEDHGDLYTPVNLEKLCPGVSFVIDQELNIDWSESGEAVAVWDAATDEALWQLKGFELLKVLQPELARVVAIEEALKVELEKRRAELASMKGPIDLNPHMIPMDIVNEVVDRAEERLNEKVGRDDVYELWMTRMLTGKYPEPVFTKEEKAARAEIISGALDEVLDGVFDKDWNIGAKTDEQAIAEHEELTAHRIADKVMSNCLGKGIDPSREEVWEVFFQQSILASVR